MGRRRARATQGVCEGGRNYPRRGVRNHAPLGACLNTLSSSIFHAERCVVKLSEKGREWHRELFSNEESKRAHVKKERNPVKKWSELPQPAGLAESEQEKRKKKGGKCDNLLGAQNPSAHEDAQQ